MTVRYISTPVFLPKGCSKVQEAQLTARALYRHARELGDATAGLPAASRRGSSYPAGPPSPGSCATVAEFLDRMRDLKAWAKVSLRDLEAFAHKRGETLPHSTIGRIMSGANVSQMPTAEQLATFVLGCGLSEEQWREWAKVWADVLFAPASKRPVMTIGGGRYQIYAVGSRARRMFERIEENVAELFEQAVAESASS